MFFTCRITLLTNQGCLCLAKILGVFILNLKKDMPISRLRTTMTSLPWASVVGSGKAVSTGVFTLVALILSGCSPPSSLSFEEQNSTTSESFNTAGFSTSIFLLIKATSSENASYFISIRSFNESFSELSDNFSFAAWLYRPTRPFAWYFACIATMFPEANFPISLLSFTRGAHSLTILSISRVEPAGKIAARRLNHKKKKPISSNRSSCMDGRNAWPWLGWNCFLFQGRSCLPFRFLDHIFFLCTL